MKEEEIEIITKKISVSLALQVNALIPEFSDWYSDSYFKERITWKDEILLWAYISDKLIWYMIWYNRDNDTSYYCRMAWVIPNFRQNWALKKMMSELFATAKEKWYTSVKIKTRNSRREMLSFLVKNNFNFIEIETKEEIVENRLLLQKLIS